MVPMFVYELSKELDLPISIDQLSADAEETQLLEKKTRNGRREGSAKPSIDLPTNPHIQTANRNAHQTVPIVQSFPLIAITTAQ